MSKNYSITIPEITLYDGTTFDDCEVEVNYDEGAKETRMQPAEYPELEIIKILGTDEDGNEIELETEEIDRLDKLECDLNEKCAEYCAEEKCW